MTRAPAVLRVAVTSQLRARRFYERVLRLRPAPNSPAGHLRFWAGNRLIELHARSRQGGSVQQAVGKSTHVALRVADFCYEYQRMTSAGGSFVGQVQQVRGVWRARVSDPDGNIYTVLEVRTPAASAQQSRS